jgi:hypothetical protein
MDTGFESSGSSREVGDDIRDAPKSTLAKIAPSKIISFRISIKEAIPEIDNIRKVLPSQEFIEAQAYLDCSILVIKEKGAVSDKPMLLSTEHSKKGSYYLNGSSD